MVRINLNSFKIIRQYLIRAFVLFVITVWTQTSESLFKKKKLEMLYNRALKILDKKPIQWQHCHI